MGCSGPVRAALWAEGGAQAATAGLWPASSAGLWPASAGLWPASAVGTLPASAVGTLPRTSAARPAASLQAAGTLATRSSARIFFEAVPPARKDLATARRRRFGSGLSVGPVPAASTRAASEGGGERQDARTDDCVNGVGRTERHNHSKRRKCGTAGRQEGGRRWGFTGGLLDFEASVAFCAMLESLLCYSRRAKLEERERERDRVTSQTGR